MFGFLHPPPHSVYNEVPKHGNKLILVIFCTSGMLRGEGLFLATP
jgi:hypothetical protein